MGPSYILMCRRIPFLALTPVSFRQGQVGKFRLFMKFRWVKSAANRIPPVSHLVKIWKAYFCTSLTTGSRKPMSLRSSPSSSDDIFQLSYGVSGCLRLLFLVERVICLKTFARRSCLSGRAPSKRNTLIYNQGPKQNVRANSGC